MGKKTIKDVESSLFLLGEEFKDMKTKFDTLFEKHDTLVRKNDISVEKHDSLVEKYDILIRKHEVLESKYDELDSKKKDNLKGNKCVERFETSSDLQNHNKIKHFKKGKFNCDDCEKCFVEEWKFTAHKKSHSAYPCDQCEKTFKFNEMKEKHIEAAHRDKIIYCSFYNNKKECPYGDKKCMFVHKDSEECKFGKACERNNCMYKHDSEDNSDENIDDSENEGESDEEEIEDERNDYEKTFHNPYQSDDSEHNDEEEDDNAKAAEEVINYKCELCMFTTTDNKRLQRHTFENHSVKGAYVCHNCKKKCETRKMFNSHRYHGCGS